MIKLLHIYNKSFFCLCIIFPLTFSCKNEIEYTYREPDYSTWNNYAGTKDGMRYSSDTTINKSNVDQLTVAWKYSTNDKDNNGRSQNQCNPIIIDGILYATSPKSKLFALNAATGK